MDQAFLDKVLEAIENNLANENFGVEELALEIGISRVHLHRKLKFLTGKSTGKLIKEFRLKKAMELLQNNVATSSEISSQVGFGSPSYFNTCFREYYGYPPGKVKRKRSLKATRKHAVSRRYIFASLAIILVVVLIVLNIIPRRNRAIETEIPDKSIAVLPFKSLSVDPEMQYRADGVMLTIQLHLSSIEDLDVLSSLSVEQYRTTDKTATEICQELDVGYLLTGSFSKYGDHARLNVQLIQSGKEDCIWTHEYNSEWKDIFIVESEVAQSIAGELRAVISPEEKELIENIPTTNLTALDFYLRGREEYQKYLTENRREEYEKYLTENINREALEKVEYFYNEALNYDPTFAQAYLGLANVYLMKHYWKEFFSESFMDSAVILADKALSYDEKLSEAYLIRGRYYREAGNAEKATLEYNKGIQYNPNDWRLYNDKAHLYRHGEQVKVLDNAYKAAGLHRGSELVDILLIIGMSYGNTGFYEQAKDVAEEVLRLKGDSLEYCKIQGFIEKIHENYSKAGEFYLKGNSIDSTLNLELAIIYMALGQYKESLKYYKKARDQWGDQGSFVLYQYQRIAYAYSINGYEKEANYYFEMAIENCNNEIQLGRYRSEQYFTYYDLASIYAFLGEKEKAYKNLRIFSQRQIIHNWYVWLVKNDVLFESIRDEPEFQQIVKDMETKYQAEHERVRQWLEENDML